MKRIILILISCFLIGCVENNGDTNIETGGATATSENQNESTSGIEQSQLDELLPELICNECNKAEMEALGRMYQLMIETISDLSESPIQTPVGQVQNPGISIIIESYSTSAADIQDGADTQQIETDFQDTVSDLLDNDEIPLTNTGNTTT
jgi:hypothetical protein